MLFGPNARKSQEHTPQIENLHLEKTRHMAWNILTDRTDAKKLNDDKRLATETQAIKLLCINSKPR
tara:strand:+ start:425 stop:622 length:198 start_codon:yes stop_codon:yes gene_type:complete